MNEEPVVVISPPSLDLSYYFTHTIDFLSSHYPQMFAFAQSSIGIIIGISIPISIMLFIGILISVERLKVIRKKEEEIYNAKVEMAYEPDAQGNIERNTEMARKWDTVLVHLESKNPNDWRQAIIEADIILGDLLTKLGYQGEGIGEQLKRATKADFITLDSAWEAHRIRNNIAHEGSDFVFTQHEARRVIHLYRRVFEEFYFV